MVRRVAVVALACLASGCGEEELASAWRVGEPDADGRLADWSGATTTLEGGALTVGVINDAHRMYLYLRPETPQAALSLYRQGFTLWVGEGDRRFGLRFPVETRFFAEGERLAGPEESHEADGQPPAPALKLVDLLDHEGEVVRGGRIAGMTGVSLAAFPGTGLTAVQVAVDLRPAAEGAVAVGAAPGEAVRLGLTSPKPEKMEVAGRDGGRPAGGPGGGRMPGGGPGPHGGPDGEGGPGPEGGPGGRRGFSPPEALDLSARVVLAAPAARDPR